MQFSLGDVQYIPTYAKPKSEKSLALEGPRPQRWPCGYSLRVFGCSLSGVMGTHYNASVPPKPMGLDYKLTP